MSKRRSTGKCEQSTVGHVHEDEADKIRICRCLIWLFPPHGLQHFSRKIQILVIVILISQVAPRPWPANDPEHRAGIPFNRSAPWELAITHDHSLQRTAPIAHDHSVAVYILPPYPRFLGQRERTHRINIVEKCTHFFR